MEHRGGEAAERLRRAAEEGDLDETRRLLAGGADPNDFDEIGRTALHYATRHEHLAIVALLLAHGARVDARHESSLGNTPLRDIAATCSLALARVLVEAGANPTLPGWMQTTALDHSRKRLRGDGPAVHDLLMRAARRFVPGTR
jgi:ankyrin repeat protein